LNNPDNPVDMGVQADLAIHILKALFAEHGRKQSFLALIHLSFNFYSSTIRNSQGIVPDTS
jgi:hypothetical protein